MRRSGRNYWMFLSAIELAKQGDKVLFWCPDSEQTSRLFTLLTGIETVNHTVQFPDAGSIEIKTTKEMMSSDDH